MILFKDNYTSDFMHKDYAENFNLYLLILNYMIV